MPNKKQPTRTLNDKLHETYSFIPAPSPEDAQQEFERFNKGIQTFTNDEADALEALKVRVWYEGGPEIFNTETSKDYGFKKPRAYCTHGQHDIYTIVRVCKQCEAEVCVEHSEVLLGETFCKVCARGFRNV